MPCESGDSDRAEGEGADGAHASLSGLLSVPGDSGETARARKGNGRRPGGASFLGTEAREGAVKAPALLVTLGRATWLILPVVICLSQD
ncbi:hypothetical protein CLOM_g8241 [Closterium sp. NIES-68]|nr:hypothetical protein CLOM_g8241 [Closterium sp. NIES-68]